MWLYTLNTAYKTTLGKKWEKLKKEKSLSVLLYFSLFFLIFFLFLFTKIFQSSKILHGKFSFLFIVLHNSTLWCNACNRKIIIRFLGKFFFFIFSDFHRWYGKLIFILYFVEIDCMENFKVYWKSRFSFHIEICWKYFSFCGMCGL